MLRKTVVFLVEAMEGALKSQRVKEVERRKRVQSTPSTEWGGRVVRGEASGGSNRQGTFSWLNSTQQDSESQETNRRGSREREANRRISYQQESNQQNASQQTLSRRNVEQPTSTRWNFNQDALADQATSTRWNFNQETLTQQDAEQLTPTRRKSRQETLVQRDVEQSTSTLEHSNQEAIAQQDVEQATSTRWNFNQEALAQRDAEQATSTRWNLSQETSSQEDGEQATSTRWNFNQATLSRRELKSQESKQMDSIQDATQDDSIQEESNGSPLKEKFIALTGRTKNFSFKNIPWSKPWQSLRQVNWKSPQAMGALGTLVLLLVVAGYVVFRMQTAYSVVINGQTVAVVNSQSQYEQVLEELLVTKGGGQKATFKDEIELVPTQANSMQVATDEEVRRQLESTLHLWVKGSLVKIDGQPRLTVASEELARRLVDQTISYFTVDQLPEGATIDAYDLKSTIEYEPIDVSLDQVLPEDQALRLLRNGELKNFEYEVKDGDSLWTIARVNNMLVKELKEANPTLATERLQIGQKISLAKPEAILNVNLTYKFTQVEEIPFATKVETDKSLSYRQEVVKSEGEKGSKEVTYRVTRVNNNQIQQDLIEEKPIKEAKTKLVARGPQTYSVASASRGSSKSLSISYGGGSGQLVRPVPGIVTSNYGPRWGKFHTGIDYDLETGDPVHAAAAGIVTHAQYDGGYGYNIIIDHGDGLSTQYAHLDRLLVGVGQEVGRYETIGKGGNTGNSTGSHLHFEVRINGKHQPPTSYLN